jgi:photosystem II stability/assembly factor-like uncharacterized protein
VTRPLYSDAQLLPGGPAFVTEAGGETDIALWRTDDLGQTFRPALHRGLLGAVRFYGLWFLSPRCGFAVGEDEDGDGAAYVTRDGGASWEQATSLAAQAPGIPLTQIVFADDRRGLAVGAGDAMWRTEDAGGEWAPVSVPGLSSFGVFFLDGTGVGWVLSQTIDQDFRILRTQHFQTRDAGASYEALEDRLGGEPLRVDVSACCFWDLRDGVLCGPDGLVLRTGDGARTWRAVASGVDADLNFLAPLGPGTAYAAGMQGRMLRTDDRGANWRRVETGVGSELHAMAFADADSGFVVGEDGVALWTRDGGRTFRRTRI